MVASQVAICYEGNLSPTVVKQTCPPSNSDHFYEFAQVWKIIFQTSCLEFHSSGGCISGWNVEFLQHISNVRHSAQAETPSKSTRHVLHKMRGDAATGHATYDLFFHILSNVHHCHHHLWGYKPIYIPLFWALHEFVMVTMGDTTKKKLAKIGNIPR